MVFGLPIVKPMWIKLQTLLRTTHLFFFFQAEDGIRDRNLTGVQTCALPIYCQIAECSESIGRSQASGDARGDSGIAAWTSRARATAIGITRWPAATSVSLLAVATILPAEIGRASCRERV